MHRHIGFRISDFGFRIEKSALRTPHSALRKQNPDPNLRNEHRIPHFSFFIFRFSFFIFFVLFSLFTDLHAESRDFLRREPEEGYLNYGTNEYRSYRRKMRVDKRYDYFGNFLMEGFQAFRLDERRPGGSLILKDQIYQSWFNNLVIGRDSYAGWDMACTVGDEVRTMFTPFTLYQAGFNGIRWDVSTPKNKFTLLASRGFDSTLFPRSHAFSWPVTVTSLAQEITQVEEDNPVYTFGGHWETKVGDVLTLGATLVNQHQIHARRKGQESFLRGNIPYPEMQPPKSLTVRFSDDSPEDERDGAAVFSVVVDLAEQGTGRVITSDPGRSDYDATLEPVVRGGKRMAGHLEAHGEETVDYVFTIPEGFSPARATFRAVVANDYRISLCQSHDFFRELTGRFEERETPFFTLIRSKDRVEDFSNKQLVVFDYGLSTGQTIWGLNVEANLVGLKIRGELEGNELYRKFPVLKGFESTGQSQAWFINVIKRLGPFSVGYEQFHVGSAFGGGFDSQRGGVVLYTDKAGSAQDESVRAEFPLVDDNDDEDRYADDNIRDFPGGGEIESGVFPGLDKDHDNVPDDDRNSNGVPDYEEPFLLYYSDPQDFVYGVDLNNNGVMDERENDDRPDYPYDRDTAGRHVFLTVSPITNLHLTAGVYRVGQLSGGGEALSRYGRMAYRYHFPKFGDLEVDHESKRVKDTVPDPVFVYRTGQDNSPLNPPDPDLLLMRDSWVHTSFAEARYTQIPRLNLIQNVQLIYNLQRDDRATLVDEGDRIRTATMVSKADYTIPIGKRLTVMPMIKRLQKKVVRRSKRRPLESWTQVAPILRVNLELTPKTTLQIGQQGVRFSFFKGAWRNRLAFRFHDEVDGSRSYSATDFVLMVSNQSDYMGYKVAVNAGIQRRSEEYEDELVAQTRNATISRFFVNVVVGY